VGEANDFGHSGTPLTHDALIDAVIVVENLFGHGGTAEVGLRVSSALALLLEQE
jgi:hypothetical protein